MIYAISNGRDEPPNFESTAPGKCKECWVELDLEDEPNTRMDDGSILCAECRVMCAGRCGDWLTDMKSAVNLRCPVTGRRELYCLECAIEEAENLCP